MQCHTLSNNAIVVLHDDIDYLFSYDSLQAYHIHGEVTVTAKPKISVTTEKHIRMFVAHVTYDTEIVVVRVKLEQFYEGIE